VKQESVQKQTLILGGGGFKEGITKRRFHAKVKKLPDPITHTRRMRSETTMSLKWIAENLKMGTWTHVSNLLRPTRQDSKCVKDKD
jgi:hypothetical protein